MPARQRISVVPEPAIVSEANAPGVPVIRKEQKIEGRFFPLLFDPRVMGN